jgi:hypothetical protein
MFTRQFWKLTAERAVKVFAETLAGVLVVSGTGLFSVDWKAALSTAGMAMVVSVLTSLASLRCGPPNSPSVVRTDPPSVTVLAPTATPSVHGAAQATVPAGATAS